MRRQHVLSGYPEFEVFFNSFNNIYALFHFLNLFFYF